MCVCVRVCVCVSVCARACSNSSRRRLSSHTFGTVCMVCTCVYVCVCVCVCVCVVVDNAQDRTHLVYMDVCIHTYPYTHGTGVVKTKEK